MRGKGSEGAIMPAKSAVEFTSVYLDINKCDMVYISFIFLVPPLLKIICSFLV